MYCENIIALTANIKKSFDRHQSVLSGLIPVPLPPPLRLNMAGDDHKSFPPNKSFSSIAMIDSDYSVSVTINNDDFDCPLDETYQYQCTSVSSEADVDEPYQYQRSSISSEADVIVSTVKPGRRKKTENSLDQIRDTVPMKKLKGKLHVKKIFGVEPKNSTDSLEVLDISKQKSIESQFHIDCTICPSVDDGAKELAYSNDHFLCNLSGGMIIKDEDRLISFEELCRLIDVSGRNTSFCCDDSLLFNAFTRDTDDCSFHEELSMLQYASPKETQEVSEGIFDSFC